MDQLSAFPPTKKQMNENPVAYRAQELRSWNRLLKNLVIVTQNKGSSFLFPS